MGEHSLNVQGLFRNETNSWSREYSFFPRLEYPENIELTQLVKNTTALEHLNNATQRTKSQIYADIARGRGLNNTLKKYATQSDKLTSYNTSDYQVINKYGVVLNNKLETPTDTKPELMPPIQNNHTNYGQDYHLPTIFSGTTPNIYSSSANNVITNVYIPEIQNVSENIEDARIIDNADSDKDPFMIIPNYPEEIINNSQLPFHISNPGFKTKDITNDVYIYQDNLDYPYTDSSIKTAIETTVYSVVPLTIPYVNINVNSPLHVNNNTSSIVQTININTSDYYIEDTNVENVEYTTYTIS